MSIITQFRVCPDHRARTVELLGQMVNALHQAPPYTEEQIVVWEGLERVVQRFVGSAQAIEHPIGVHFPDFWDHWRRFAERNERISRARRSGKDPKIVEARAPADQLPQALRDIVGSQQPHQDAALTPDKLARMRKQTEIDNNTDIASFKTIWGADEAEVLFEDGSTGLLCGDRGSVPVRFGLQPSEMKHGSAANSHDAERAPDENPSDKTPKPSGEEDAPLGEAIKARLDALAIKLGNRRADESHGRVLRFASDVLGDVRIGDITKKKLRALEIALGEIPTRRGLPRSACGSLYSRYLYAREHGWIGLERISQTTLKNTYFGTMNSFLTWAGAKHEWSPPEFRFDQDVAEAPAAEDRDAFSNEELIRFFSLPLFTNCLSTTHIWKPGDIFAQNAHYWGYLIHFFMGLRPSEIGQLVVDDIVQSEGLHWIDLRDDKDGSKGKKRLKSKAARRLVPIPRLLVDLGLVDRSKTLKKTGEKRLFAEWTIYEHPQSGRKMHGHFLSKSWQYVKESYGFKRKNLSLYSGRHTLAGWYDAMRLPDRIRMRLLGHAPSQVAHGYGPENLNEDEARVALSEELKIQVDIADILLTAKLKAEYGMLITFPNG